ncbi:MAG: hypothetical protein ACYCOU_15055 [Sulfobacillus sp.]
MNVWKLGDVGVINRWDGRNTTVEFCKVSGFTAAGYLRLQGIDSVSSSGGKTVTPSCVTDSVVPGATANGNNYLYNTGKSMFIRGSENRIGSFGYVKLTKWDGFPVKEEWLSD